MKEPNVYTFFDECYVYYGDYAKDIEKLNSIIKEVREYIKKNYPVCAGSDLLEILDKGE